MKKLMIILAAVTLVASFALTAAAAEWNFYGSARMTTFYEMDDQNNADDDDTTWGLQGNARIGATVKVNDTLVGGFEYGSTPNLRKLYGEWDFGAGKLLVGQTYTPACTYFYSNQVWASDNDLLDSGQQYAGRKPMIRLTFGDFKLAFISPNTSDTAGIGGDTDTTLPKIEAAYNMKMDAFFVDVYGGYNSFDQADISVDSYLVGVGGGFDVGSLYIKANVYYAQNGSAYGLLGIGDDSLSYNARNQEVIDVDTFGYLAVVGFKASDALTLEAGYGAVSHEQDVNNSDSDDASTLYVNASITLAPGVFIVPEIGFIDYQDDAGGADEGDMTYFGAKWQMNF
jgi:hypothetical protein